MTARDAAAALVRVDGGHAGRAGRGEGASEREVRDDAARELEGFLASWCCDDSELAPIARHVLAVPGKRVRGRLTLACASLAGGGDRDAVRAAAAVELLHEASLVHDDVCDRSLRRRGAPSVAAAFGMRVAARFGIWLAARSLALIGELEVRRRLGLAFAPLTALAEGQLLETVRCGESAAERRDHYLAVVRAKTGALMRMACDVGGRLAGLSPRELAALAAFAEAFGTAFQLRDDIRDLEAPTSLGKPGGSDLANGIWTWPVLEWLGDRPDGAARTLAARPLDALRAELEASGALPRTRLFATAELARARRALLGVPDAPGRAWLHELSEIAA
jgi:geranylgeranyl pyrophosphate synthase